MAPGWILNTGASGALAACGGGVAVGVCLSAAIDALLKWHALIVCGSWLPCGSPINGRMMASVACPGVGCGVDGPGCGLRERVYRRCACCWE